MDLSLFFGHLFLTFAFIGFMVYEINWRYVAYLLVKFVERKRGK